MPITASILNCYWQYPLHIAVRLYHQTHFRGEQVLLSSLLLAHHTHTQDPYSRATLCGDGSCIARLSSISLYKPFTVTTIEAAGWPNIYAFATCGIPPTRMGWSIEGNNEQFICAPSHIRTGTQHYHSRRASLNLVCNALSAYFLPYTFIYQLA